MVLGQARTEGNHYLARTQLFRKTNISYPVIRTRTCAYQGLSNVSFSRNFTYVLKEWFKTPWHVRVTLKAQGILFLTKTCLKYLQNVENRYKSGRIYPKKTESKEIKSCTCSQLYSCWKKHAARESDKGCQINLWQSSIEIQIRFLVDGAHLAQLLQCVKNM